MRWTMILAAVLLAGCGVQAAGRSGGDGGGAAADQPDDVDAERGSSLVADLVAQTQLAPGGSAAAIVVDAGQVPRVLLQFVTEPCLAASAFAFEGLVDQVYVPVWGVDVDFIMFAIDPSVHALAPFGITDESVTHYHALRHFDRGIGTDHLPERSVGPSSLRGYTLLGRREEMVTGVVLHELGHAWAAHLTGPPVLAAQIFPPDADSDGCEFLDRRVSHWNNAQVNGMMGGWNDGVCDGSEPTPYLRFRIPYAPLELYLMGLAEPEEVPPVEDADLNGDTDVDTGRS